MLLFPTTSVCAILALKMEGITHKIGLVLVLFMQITAMVSAEQAKGAKTISNTETDMAVYRSDDFGYEIRYPKEWQFQKDYIRRSPKSGLRDFLWIGTLSVQVWDTSLYSYEQIATPPPGGIDPDSIIERQVKLDGYPGKEISYISVGDDNSGIVAVKESFVLKDNLVYKIGCAQECERIMSSFRFLR